MAAVFVPGDAEWRARLAEHVAPEFVYVGPDGVFDGADGLGDALAAYRRLGLRLAGRSRAIRRVVVFEGLAPGRWAR